MDSGQWSELERIIEGFEEAWRGGAVPLVADYVPPDGAIRTAVLLELATTDLQWRWRRGLAAATEDYLAEFPELGREPQAIVELATCEFLARRGAGSPPNVDEFLTRFQQAADELGPALRDAATTCSAIGAETSDAGGKDGSFPPPVEEPANVPRRVGRYELVRSIGGGSFGTVYEAVDSELQRRVAVKLPRHAVNARAEERTRFIREARHLAQLSHAAIVPVLDAGLSDGLFYIVCSLIKGPTLADRLRAGPLARARPRRSWPRLPTRSTTRTSTASSIATSNQVTSCLTSKDRRGSPILVWPAAATPNPR